MKLAQDIRWRMILLVYLILPVVNCDTFWVNKGCKSQLNYLVRYLNGSQDTVIVVRDVSAAKYAASEVLIDTFQVLPSDFVRDTVIFSIQGVDGSGSLSPNGDVDLNGTRIFVSLYKNGQLYKQMHVYPWDTTKGTMYDCGTLAEYRDSIQF